MSKRRDFLRDAAGALAAMTTLPLPGSGPRVLAGGAQLAPGDVIRVLWPRSLDAARARVVHAVDGRDETVSPAPPPAGLFLQCIEIAAAPANGLLRQGAHEFSLEVDGRRLRLGGFRVAPHRFGL